MTEDMSSSTTAGGSCMSRQRPSFQSPATGTNATFNENRRKNSDIISNDDQNDNNCFLFSEHILGGLPVMKRLFSAERNIFMALIAFRVVNALLIQTQYVPDEYWQSLEIAHSTAFGYGYQTWEWKNALRGYLYPSIFTVLYKVLGILRLDYRILLIKVPRMLQGVLAATGDFYLYKLSSRLSGTATAQWTLVCEILSWFLLYTYPRTLTNGAETALTVIALYYYPWPKLKSNGPNSTMKFLLVAGISVIVRPTSIVTWILLCGWHLQNSFSLRLCVLYILAIGSCLSLSTLVDYLGYGKFVLVQYNFFKFNVVSNLGSHYGTHPWHWYVTQGYPVIIATHLVPFVAGVCKARNRSLFTIILWTLLIYSFLSHKEFRFLMHTIPLSMHYCGIYFHSLCSEDSQQTASKSKTKPHSPVTEPPFPAPEATTTTAAKAPADSERKKEYFFQKARLTKAYYLLIFLAVTNIPLALYFNLIHQRGTVLVTKFLHDEFAPEMSTPNSRVLFLMPCHSTPFYSYIHRQVPMRFLTCEPNLSQTDHYVDEADIFFNDPLKWLNEEYNMTATKKTDNLPTHFVYYSSLHRTLFPHLEQAGYRKCGQFFHTHFPEGRCSTHVLVSCKTRTQ